MDREISMSVLGIGQGRYSVQLQCMCIHAGYTPEWFIVTSKDRDLEFEVAVNW